MKMKIKIFSFLGFLFLVLTTSAQSSEYILFRQAITELNEEYQSQKSANEKAYDESKAKMPPPQKPRITALGVPSDQKEALEKEIQKIIEEDLPVFEDHSVEESSVTQSTPKPKKEKIYIKFDQVKMFPDKTSSEPLTPAGTRSMKKTEWVSSETITTTETIEIDDIKDPAERKRWKDLAKHQSNVSLLNQTGLIKALYLESKDEKSYQNLMKDLKENGYSLESIFTRVKILDEEEKVPYVKKGILDIVQSVIR